MKIGILNVTGYSGVELARILAGHPQAELIAVTGRSEAGKHLGDVFPHLSSLDLMIEPEITDSVDIVFSALPQKASAEACAPFLRNGTKVIDISADFRLNNPTEYEQWYDLQHPCPEYLEEAVYGLTELNKSAIQHASLIANPGCYPTSAILALAPVIKEGITDSTFIIDSKSGVSGAGRGLGLGTHFSEVNESVAAYSLGGHRHLPEITQELGKISPVRIPKVTFVPHLIPMTRGILSTCYAQLKPNALPNGEKGAKVLHDLFKDFYHNEPFVTLAGSPPATKHTLGNNQCLLYPNFDQRTGRLVIVSCLDNLVKGAAGQAIQNMNIMFGLDESEGLKNLAIFP
ncbi:N-acetyl-gamma-glutamyl-phosphate reductase [SAR202 cluster bacterium AD-802-E10_MRT_200m]|nr:N-acetyl-gamma-glutamyl-phosphate reductase [SAR202 cluster bacterium AD-802-E10_MRT_200m]